MFRLNQMRSNTLTWIVAAIAATTFSMNGAEREKNFSYAPEGSEAYIWGNGKVETYDVAVRLKNDALTGSKITGFTVPLSTEEEITDIKGWLTSELRLENKTNVADITSTTATVEPDGPYGMPQINVTFSEPYTVPAEGVYVGYSLKVNKIIDDNTRYPITVTHSDAIGGFYLHSSRTYLSWKEMTEEWGAVSMMTVKLIGDFPETSLSAADLSTIYCLKGQTTEAALTLINHSESEINSIDYSYTIGDLTQTGTKTFDTPIPAQFGSSSEVSLTLKAPDTTGTYPVSVTVTRVNGQPNESNSPTATGEFNSVSFIPVNRPLVEEYTGTWCGYCPRGFIALERMNKEHEGRFVALSYHCASGYIKEPMHCLETFPASDMNFPAAILNRNGVELDPYFGSTNSTHMGIEADWQAVADQFTIADIDVDVKWDNDARTTLKATSNVRFVKDLEGTDYRISYALVGDNLNGEAWAATEEIWYQVNYYSGNTSVTGDDWKVFTEVGEAVIGLVYNDIVLAYDNQEGISGSLPADITADEAYEHSYSFNLSEVRNIYDENIINDPSKLRVVAVVTDASSGKVVNCKSSGYPAPASVSAPAIDSAATVVNVIYHDLHGRVVADPSTGGIYIRTSILSDGTEKHEKVMK